MPRTLGALVIFFAALPLCTVLQAQAVRQAPGAALPGPAAPRPQTDTPPRDRAQAPAPTGTGRIRGRVVSAETGSPLRRAQVRLSGNRPGLTPAVANTDADGRYEFLNLPAAAYNLTVSRSGYVSLEYGQQRAFERGKQLTLAEGELAERIDFALPRGGVIAGKVADDTGEPLPGVRMQAQRYQYMPGGQRRLTNGNMGLGQYITDDLGQFRVYGLMPGSYVLSAMPPPNGGMMGGPNQSAVSGSNANDGYATTYFPGTMNVEEAQTITVGLGQETTAFFSVVSARMARLSGTIRNSQGNLLSGRMLVSVRTPLGGGFTSSGGTVAPDGTFNIANVPPGEHVIEVRPMNGPPSSGATQQTAEQEFAFFPVTVAGQDIAGLVITTGLGATISGLLVFDGSSAKPQMPQPLRVGASPADPASQSYTMIGSMTQDSGVVDESGRFQIRGANGPVLFRTFAQGWILKSVMLNGQDITDVPFEAKPSMNVTGLEITLTDRQTSLAGTVKNSHGEIVKNFVLTIVPAQLRDGVVGTRFTRTVRPDQDGKYQIRGLPPGDYFAAAVESLEQGAEWDPAFQQQVRQRGKGFRLVESQLLTLDLALVQ